MGSVPPLREKSRHIFSNRNRRKFQSFAGHTLVELLAAVGVIGVLLTLLVSTITANLGRFEYPVCLSNLRNLHTSLSSYTQDNSQWPQLPPALLEEIDSSNEHAWWKETLKPYGMTDKSWLCPTLKRLTQKGEDRVYASKLIHYVPSIFDEHPFTPFRLTKIPWAMEIADVHGSGILMIYHDGSIRPFKEILGKNP